VNIFFFIQTNRFTKKNQTCYTHERERMSWYSVPHLACNRQNVKSTVLLEKIMKK